jgi:hypothetical protein
VTGAAAGGLGDFAASSSLPVREDFLDMEGI